jgi:transposase
MKKENKGEKPAPQGGRPSKFTQELGDAICDGIATSSKSLSKICEKLNVNPSTVYRWLKEDEGFRDNYARAREDQADLLADEIIEIADDSSQDTIVTAKGAEYENTEWTSRSKLRVDARKWVASKLKPKKYGDKLDLTSNNEKLSPVIIDWAGTHNGNISNTKAEGSSPDPQ